MKTAKLTAMLQGQTCIARKVFEAVPIQEAWTASQIKNALHNNEASGADLHVIRGCLRELKESGLIREPENGLFRRNEIKTAIDHHKEIPMTRTTSLKSVDAPEVQKTSLERMSELSAHLKTLGESFNTALQSIATQLEDVALSIEQEREHNSVNLDKLKQLQSLLKSLSLGE